MPTRNELSSGQRAQLGRLIQQAGRFYNLARAYEKSANEYMSSVRSLMDWGGLDRIETANFSAIRVKNGSRINLESRGAPYFGGSESELPAPVSNTFPFLGIPPMEGE